LAVAFEQLAPPHFRHCAGIQNRFVNGIVMRKSLVAIERKSKDTFSEEAIR
jgi:hypothetical protein